MAIQRVDPSVNIQPTQGAEDHLSGAQAAAARQRASAFTSIEQASDQVGQIATNYMRDYALKQAQEEASGVAEYDKDGNLLVPKNFDAPIGGGLLYSQAYTQAAEAGYKHAAINELQRKSGELQTQFPSDPESFSAKLIEYRDSKIAAMPQAIRPLMMAHFETIRAQGATSIAANRQRMVNDTNLKNAEDIRAQWVTSYVDFKRSQNAGNYSPEALAGHEAKLDDMWNNMYVPMATQAGAVPAVIQRQRMLAETQAKARIFYSGIADQAANAGEQFSVVYGASQTEIERFEKEFPGQEAQAILAMERQRAMQRANLQASGIVAGQNAEGDKFKAQGAQVDVQAAEERRQITSYNDPDYFPAGQSEALRGVNARAAERKNALVTEAQTSSVLRPLQKAELALSFSNSRDALVQQSVALAAQTSMTQAMDMTAPPQVRSQAIADIERSLSSPEMVAYSLSNQQGAYLYRSMQNTVNQARLAAATGHMQQWVADFKDGKVPEQNVSQMLARAHEQGWIGDKFPGQIRTSELAGLILTNRQKHAARAEQNRLAGEGQAAVAAGGYPTEKQAKAIEAVNPLRIFETDTADGKTKEVRPNFRDPRHRDLAIQHVADTGIIPKEMVDMFAAAPGTTNEDEKADMLSMFQATYKLFDNRFRFTPDGEQVPESDRQALVVTQMRLQMGQGFENMRAIAEKGPHASAAELATAASAEIPSRENAKPAAKSLSEVSSTLRGILNDPLRGEMFTIAHDWIFGGASPDGFWGSVFGPEAVSAWGATSRQATRVVLQSVADQSGLSRGFDSTLPIEIESSLEKMIVSGAESYKNKFAKTDEKNRIDPNLTGILSTMQKNKDDYALVEKFDGSGVVTGYRLERLPFHLALNQKTGSKLTQSQAMDLVSVYAQTNYPRHFADGGVLPQSLEVRSSQTPSGQMNYGVYGYNHQTQSSVYITDIGPQDKKVIEAMGRIHYAVASEMNDNRFAKLLSSMPVLGKMLDQKVKANIEQSMFAQAGGRNKTSEFTASVLHDLRAVAAVGPLKYLLDPEYDEAWKKFRVMNAQNTIDRYGKLPYLLFGAHSPNYFIPPQMPADNAPDMGGTFNGQIIDARPEDKQGMRDSAQALEQARSKNRGSRKPEGR